MIEPKVSNVNFPGRIQKFTKRTNTATAIPTHVRFFETTRLQPEKYRHRYTSVCKKIRKTKKVLISPVLIFGYTKAL